MGMERTYLSKVFGIFITDIQSAKGCVGQAGKGIVRDHNNCEGTSQCRRVEGFQLVFELFAFDVQSLPNEVPTYIGVAEKEVEGVRKVPGIFEKPGVDDRRR